jgi:hypothetical protein
MFKFLPFFLLPFTCVACSASFSAGDDGGGAGVDGTAGEAQSAGAGGRSGWGNGGWGSGGDWGSGECAALRQEYQAAVESARVCDKGSTDQCSPSSVAQPLGCGCPVFVNAKSDYTETAKKAYQAYQDARCEFGGVACDIYCGQAESVSCAQQSSGSGSAFLCTASGVRN